MKQDTKKIDLLLEGNEPELAVLALQATLNKKKVWWITKNDIIPQNIEHRTIIGISEINELSDIKQAEENKRRAADTAELLPHITTHQNILIISTETDIIKKIKTKFLSIKNKNIRDITETEKTRLEKIISKENIKKAISSKDFVLQQNRLITEIAKEAEKEGAIIKTYTKTEKISDKEVLIKSNENKSVKIEAEKIIETKKTKELKNISFKIQNDKLNLDFPLKIISKNFNILLIPSNENCMFYVYPKKKQSEQTLLTELKNFALQNLKINLPEKINYKIYTNTEFYLRRKNGSEKINMADYKKMITQGTDEQEKIKQISAKIPNMPVDLLKIIEYTDHKYDEIKQMHISPDYYKQISYRYGKNTEEIINFVFDNRGKYDSDLLWLVAELNYSVKNEWCKNINDFIKNRCGENTLSAKKSIENKSIAEKIIRDENASINER